MAFTDSVLIIWSNDPGDVPTAAQLNLNGRIAINQADGKLFYLNRVSGQVAEVKYTYTNIISVPTVDAIGDAGTLGKAVVRAAAQYPAGDGSLLTNVPAGAPGANSVNTAAIQNKAVTLAKLADIATATLLGNNTGASGTPVQLTPAQAKTLLGILATDVGGLGTAATLNVGTGASNIVQLGTDAKLPAIDGSKLTNLPSGNAGKLVSRAYAQKAASDTTSTTLGSSGGTPQVTGGKEIVNASLTPANTTNRIRANITAHVSSDTNSSATMVALFINGAANAVASASKIVNNSNDSSVISFSYEYAPASVSTQTLSVRFGPGLSGAVAYLNMSPNGAYNAGGTLISTLILEEIIP